MSWIPFHDGADVKRSLITIQREVLSVSWKMQRNSTDSCGGWSQDSSFFDTSENKTAFILNSWLSCPSAMLWNWNTHLLILIRHLMKLNVSSLKDGSRFLDESFWGKWKTQKLFAQKLEKARIQESLNPLLSWYFLHPARTTLRFFCLHLQLVITDECRVWGEVLPRLLVALFLLLLFFW